MRNHDNLWLLPSAVSLAYVLIVWLLTKLLIILLGRNKGEEQEVKAAAIPKTRVTSCRNGYGKPMSSSQTAYYPI